MSLPDGALMVCFASGTIAMIVGAYKQSDKLILYSPIATIVA